MNPILSIIIPVFNVEKYISQCLKSILGQYVDKSLYEVIIVNDGTQDNSMEFAYPFINQYSNCKLIEQKNQGLSVARNTGFKVAKGKYVWFIDSDDWLKEGAFKAVFHIIEHNNYEVISMPLSWIYENSNKNHCDININNDILIDGKTYINKHYEMGAIQRNVLLKSFLEVNHISFLPNILHEDGLYSRELYYLAKSVYVMSSSYYYYRQRESGSIMHSITMRNAECSIIIHKELMKFSAKRVDPEDILWFKTKQTTLFIDALSVTWSLKKSKEFRTFLMKTRHYRIQECLRCWKGNSVKEQIKLLVKAYMPLLYVRIIKMIFYIKRKLK